MYTKARLGKMSSLKRPRGLADMIATWCLPHLAILHCSPNCPAFFLAGQKGSNKIRTTCKLSCISWPRFGCAAAVDDEAHFLSRLTTISLVPLSCHGCFFFSLKKMVRQEPSVVLSFSVRIRVAARTEVKRGREQWVFRTAYLTDIFRSAGLEEGEGNASSIHGYDRKTVRLLRTRARWLNKKNKHE